MPKAVEPLVGASSIPGISSLDEMFATDDNYSFLGLENSFDFSFEYQQTIPMSL